MGGSYNVCLTPECVTAASDILHNLHPSYASIDPCENFDQFVCGGYSQRVSMEENLGILETMYNTNLDIIKNILEGEPPTFECDDDREMFDLLRTNHVSCMDEAAINTAGAYGVLDLVSNLTALFPLTDGDYGSPAAMADSDLDRFAEATAYLVSIGVSLFGEFSTYHDMEKPDTVVPWYSVLSLTPAHTTLPETPRKPFSSYAAAVDEMAGALSQLMPTKEGKEAAARLTEGIVEMTANLAAIEAGISKDPASSYQASLEMGTVTEAAQLAPALAIDRVIGRLAPVGYQTDRMMLSFKSICSSVSDVIARTPMPVLQAFMILRVAELYIPFTVANPTEDRMKEVCFDYLDNSLPWVLGKFFMDKVYSEKHQEAYTYIADAVKEVFIERVENSDWLTEESRRLVAEKARDVQLNVGYPEEDPDARNATSIKHYYAGADVTTSWFSNALSLRQWATEKSWLALLQPVNRLQWFESGVHPYTPNAVAIPDGNMIMVPAAMAVLPFSDPGLPAYVQYGRVAYIAGHEMVHNFDDIGMLISNDRTTRDWLPADTKAAFAQRADCIREQYSRVPVMLADGTVLSGDEANTPLHVNGTLTLSENIADQGGLTIAYEAWRRIAKKTNGTEMALPELEHFSSEQLFFISFGQSWCGSYAEDVVRENVASDRHAPGFARTRITPANVEAFKQAWQCQRPSPECAVW